MAASECVDRLFTQARLKVQCPPRWRVLLMAAAKRLERQLSTMREDMFVACSVDDVPTLEKIRNEAPPLLWKWWSYDLGLINRASARRRDDQLRLLPEIPGRDIISAKVAAEQRKAIEVAPYPGSQEYHRDRQRGELMIEVAQAALEQHTEIDVERLEQILGETGCGRWKENLYAALGVNYGAGGERYAGWRVMHFVAAATEAKTTGAQATTLLLDARGNPMLADCSGATALHVAAANNNLPVLEVLLLRGAPLEAKDFSGCTALIMAARSRHSPAVRMLAQWSVPADTSKDLWMAEAELHSQRFSVLRGVELLTQVTTGDRDKVRDLVTVGDGQGGDLADVSFVDSSGRSGLHATVTACSNEGRAVDMLRCLVALRADVDHADLNGETALHMAAQRQRPLVVRTLLRLKAHPGLTDKQGRTPLMLAAVGPKEARDPPIYDGVLANPAYKWRILEEVLLWDGRGKPPGPPARQFKPPEEKTLRELAEERQRALTQKPVVVYMTSNDLTKARGDALAALGFDDQWIIDEDGKINRGDRLQMSKALLTPSGDGAAGGGWNRKQQVSPFVERMQLVWEALTGPLLRMELLGTLPPRLCDLLTYLLVSMLGPRGPCFGVLTASIIGTRQAVLPSWEDFVETLKEEQLADRIMALRQLGFKGPAPKKAIWVGSVWDKGDYPREPDSIPWGALEYIDPDKAKRIYEGANQVVRVYCVVCVLKDFMSDNDSPVLLKKGWRGRVRELDHEGDAYIKFDSTEVGQLVFKENYVNMKVEATFEYEAFKGNWMPAFDKLGELKEVPTGSRARVFRGDQLQLANRLFVNEPLGLRVPAEERLRLVGEKLLCPLLRDAARGLAARGVELEEVEERREWLRYVAGQIEEPAAPAPEPSNVLAWQKERSRLHARRLPYEKAWTESRGALARQLSDAPPEVLALGTLTPYADSFLLEDGKFERADGKPPRQSSVLPPEFVTWLRRQDSSRAFIELRRINAVTNADDFNVVIKGMVARSPKFFSEHLWRGTFYLLLWGRAKHLQSFFLKELRNRLPDGAVLHGPFVRPRSDFLLEVERKAQEDAIQKRRDDAHWQAWHEKQRITKLAVGKFYEEADYYKAEAKKLDARFARHMRSWNNVAWVGEAVKPNAGEEALASGTAAPAARMLKTKAPPAVDRSLIESKAATGPDGLPIGLTDVLRAQVVCDTPEVLREAFAGLCKPPAPPPKADAKKGGSGEEGGGDGGESRFGHIVTFRALRIVNDFHKHQVGIATFARTARVLVVGCLSVCPRGIGVTPVQQLVEVEVLLPPTLEAQWLAEYMKLDPADFEPERVLKPPEPP